MWNFLKGLFGRELTADDVLPEADRKPTLSEQISDLTYQLEQLQQEESAYMKLRKLKTDAEKVEQELSQSKDQLAAAYDRLDRLKNQHRMEDESIKHMLKMNEERQELANQKFQSACEKDRDTAIAKCDKDHRVELQSLLSKQIADGDHRFEQILQRLPDASMSFSKKEH